MTKPLAALAQSAMYAPLVNTPPAWYPDPQIPGVLRYHDGTGWTAHTAPAAGRPAQPPVKPGVNHAIHLLICLFTCGLWLPVYLIIAGISHAQKPVR